MTTPLWPPILRHLRQSAAQQEHGRISDAQLLHQFARHGDQAAFEVLVWRHGPMVLGVCRRLLPNRHDAEDAFQATLLVLARKARSVSKGSSVGSWLYKVAYRVALRARVTIRKRERHEQIQPDLPLALARPEAHVAAWQELRGVLDEELNRLPEKYRAPVVLCYLEGLTNAEAARQLGWPAGTIKTRLARARQLLSERLAQRGLALAAGLVATSNWPTNVLARVSGPAIDAVLRAAGPIALGRAAVRCVATARVAAITEGVLRTMVLMKVKMVAAVVATSVALATLGVASYRTWADEPGEEPAGVQEDSAGRIAKLKKEIAELQAELRQAEQAASRPEWARRKQTPIALLFGTVPVTRAEIGNHLVDRMSADQLDSYLNYRILMHACQQRGITVTDREVDAALAETKQALHADGAAFQEVLRKQNKTLLEWKSDVIRPRLLLGKLCRDRVAVTEKDLREAYEAGFGEKVECQVVLWPMDRQEEAQRVSQVIHTSPGAFELAASTQATPSLARTQGRLPPLNRHSSANADLERAAFGLQAGELSPLIQTAEGWMIVKCLRRLPADSTKSLDEVQDSLKQEVVNRKGAKTMQKVFEELKQEAHPKILWRPDGERTRKAD
jgi:RNA polymerase sigma factor (sigma-70 family)